MNFCFFFWNEFGEIQMKVHLLKTFMYRSVLFILKILKSFKGPVTFK